MATKLLKMGREERERERETNCGNQVAKNEMKEKKKNQLWQPSCQNCGEKNLIVI